MTQKTTVVYTLSLDLAKSPLVKSIQVPDLAETKVLDLSLNPFVKPAPGIYVSDAGQQERDHALTILLHCCCYAEISGAILTQI